MLGISNKGIRSSELFSRWSMPLSMLEAEYGLKTEVTIRGLRWNSTGQVTDDVFAYFLPYEEADSLSLYHLRCIFSRDSLKVTQECQQLFY